jgi:ElaB/YqjD/DUF883 family membrane-anchored ribosome-binding protein
MADTQEKIGDVGGRAKAWTEKSGESARESLQALGAQANDTSSGVVGAVKDKAQEVAAGASELAGKAKDTAQQLASSVGAAAVHARDKAVDISSAAVSNVGHIREDVTAMIRRHPLESLLLAVGMGFGAGFLAAQLMRRS